MYQQSALAIALQWNSLAETIPAHFNLQGEAGGTMERNILPIYPLISAAVCLVAYLIALKAVKFRTGAIILVCGISLVILLSTLVTLTAGKMPALMLAEPVVLLAAIVGAVVSIIRSRKQFS